MPRLKMSKLSKIKRTPAIRRTPVKKKSIHNNRKTMLRWRLMRNAEYRRRESAKKYTRYKNNWFISLISEATKTQFWVDWDIKRLKNLRVLLEKNYDIPINFYSAFIYYATYKYMHWGRRDFAFRNYVGFISNESVIIDFANFLSTRNMRWRKRNTRWPEDYHDKWGIKTSVKSQKLGHKDKLVKHDLMSNQIERIINRYL
jgi:hypothetical protein